MTGTPLMPIPTRASELRVDWLNQVLAESSFPAVAEIRHNPIGSGFYGSISRIDLTYEDSSAGPQTIVAKFAAEDPKTREALRGLGIYEREYRFYTELASELPVRTPACYFAHFDPETQATVLLLEYIEGDVFDDVTGATLEQAQRAFDLAAGLHAELSGSRRLEAPWIQPIGGSPVLEGLVAATEAAIPVGTEIVRECSPDWMMARADRAHEIIGNQLSKIHRLPHTLIHLDFRLSNMILERREDGALVLVDFHSLLRGPGICDLSFFALTALTVTDRREWEDDLARRYLERVHDWHGPTWPDWFKTAWRRYSLFLAYNAIRNATVLDMSNPGSKKFVFACVERACAAAEDHDAIKLLDE